MQNLRSGKNAEGLAEFFPRVAYIAKKQAEKDYSVTEESFYSWLAEFEALDFANAASDIMVMISGSEKNTSKAKN